MKAVVTRVNSASVCIDGALHGQIGRGFLILLGIGPDDTPVSGGAYQNIREVTTEWNDN